MRARTLPQMCYRPRLWLWPGQAVYVGASLGLDPHCGSVSCLAIAVDGTFTVWTRGSPGPTVRSALIPPRLVHKVVADTDQMAFCYLDPASARHRHCQRAMTTMDGTIAYQHRHQDVLAATAADLTDAAKARAWLDLAAAPHAMPDHPPAADRMDPRIRAAVAVMRSHGAGDNQSATHLATLVGLSVSRFLHLFREHTGTSFRRYRLWLRMLRATELILGRAELTTAAVDAGFASPSHFSVSFHAMFGIPPSHLLGTDIHLAS